MLPAEKRPNERVLRFLRTMGAIRAGVLLLTGLFLLIWPGITSRTMLVIGGIFAFVWGGVEALSLLGERERYRGWALVGIVSTALAGLLVIYIALSGAASARIGVYVILVGGLLAGGVTYLLEGWRMRARRQAGGWGRLARGVGQSVVGLVLLAYALSGVVWFVYGLALWMVVAAIAGLVADRSSWRGGGAGQSSRPDERLAA